MKLHFSGMSNTVSIDFKIDEFSPDHKCRLFKALLDDLGISDRFHEEKQNKAFELIQEQFDKVCPNK